MAFDLQTLDLRLATPVDARVPPRVDGADGSRKTPRRSLVLRAVPGRVHLDTMKVSFTPKEYARLLELAHLGMQVVAGRAPKEENTALARYAEIEQRLYEMATPLGCGDLVTVGSDGRLTASEKLRGDERLGKILATYDNDTFWHELVTRLADRDLAAEQAKRLIAGKGGPPIDTEARVARLEDAYWDEFEKNDLANVILLKGGQG